MKSTNIRNILLFPFSILIMCFSATVAMVSLYNSQGYIDDLLEEIIIHTKSHIFTDLAHYLQNHEQITDSNRIFVQQLYLQSPNLSQQHISQLLKQQLAQSHSFDGISFQKGDGKPIGYIKTQHNQSNIESLSLASTAIHLPPETKQTTSSQWHGPTHIPGHQPPVLQHQQTIVLAQSNSESAQANVKETYGTLQTFMFLDRLNNSLTRNFKLHHGYAFIIDSNEQLIAQSKMPPHDFNQQSHSQFVASALKHIKQSPSNTLEFAKYRYRIATFDMEFASPFQWQLVILLEETSTHSQATSYSQNALITIICGMLLTMLLSGYLANQISKPIRHLNTRLLSWNEHSSSNEDMPNHLPRIEELEQLAESITHLQNRVSSTMQELQKTINENRHFINEIEKMALVAENTDDMVLICDPDTQIEWANDSFFDKYQYQLDDVLYRKVFDVLLPIQSETDTHPQDVFSKLESSDTVSLQQSHADKSGAAHWIHMDIHKIRDNNDEVRHFIFVMQDITDQKRYETELAKWKTLFYAADWGIAFLEGDEHCMSLVNPAYAKHHGYELEDLMYRPISISYPSQTHESITEYYSIAKQKGSVTFETEHVKKNGKHFPVIQNISVYYDQNGQVGGLITSIQDVSEIKNLQSQLIQSQKMEAMGTLAGGMAHDFNNILASILGNAELSNLYLDMMTDKQQQAHTGELQTRLSAIIKACNRASDLTNKILSYSRMATTDFTPLKLRDVLEESVTMIEPLLPANIAIQVDIPDDERYVAGNESQLQQVFVNLLANAIHAIQATDRKDGKITVTMEIGLSEDNQAVIRLIFADNGCGIPAESLGHIFDPFFTTKEKGKGTGLGLSVVMGIMQAHKVFVSVASQPNQSTEFTLLFPVTESPPPQTNKGNIEKSLAKPLSPKHLVMIDDEAPLLDIWQRLLTSQGYQVSIFEQPKQALCVIENEPQDVDLVITDYDMEGMTGEELCEILSHKHPRIPLVMLTGYSEKMNEARANELGIKSLLKKPIALNALLNAVNNAMQ